MEGKAYLDLVSTLIERLGVARALATIRRGLDLGAPSPTSFSAVAVRCKITFTISIRSGVAGVACLVGLLTTAGSSEVSGDALGENWSERVVGTRDSQVVEAPNELCDGALLLYDVALSITVARDLGRL